MLFVSMEKITSIISKKIRGAVPVTIWSQVRDVTNLDSDECSEAAGPPGVSYVWAMRCVVSDYVLLVM